MCDLDRVSQKTNGAGKMADSRSLTLFLNIFFILNVFPPRSSKEDYIPAQSWSYAQVKIDKKHTFLNEFLLSEMKSIEVVKLLKLKNYLMLNRNITKAHI